MEEVLAEAFGYLFLNISRTDTAILALLSGFILVKTRNLSELMAAKDEAEARKVYSFRGWIKEILMIGNTRVAGGIRVVPPVPPYLWEYMLRLMALALFLGSYGWLLIPGFHKLFALVTS